MSEEGETSRSRLEDHKRLGKLLLPPLKQLPVDIEAVQWLRDVLPDMLWLLTMSRSEDDKTTALASRVLDVINEELAAELGTSQLGWVVDGRLTSFESVPEGARPRILERLAEESLHAKVFTPAFCNAMILYPDAPGSWLLGAVQEPDIDEAEEFLAGVVFPSLHGSAAVATRAKTIAFRSRVEAGQIEIPDGGKFTIFEALPDWPGISSSDLKESLESLVRAGFYTMCFPLEEEGWAPIREWACSFWAANWSLFTCVVAPRQRLSKEEAEEERDRLLEAWTELFGHFVAIADTVDPELCDPDRLEVLTGLVARAVRLARVISGSPILWSGEFGGGLARSVLECVITLRWFVSRESDHPGDYAAFKRHGRGKLKLYKLHLEAEIEKAGADTPPEILGQLEQLQAEVGSETEEELQVVDLSSRYGGTNLRVMAQEIGMEREYNTMLAPASAATHGEWPSLARYSLTLCLHPLHRGHNLANTDWGATYGPGLAWNAVGMSRALLTDYEEAILATGDGSVEAAG